MITDTRVKPPAPPPPGCAPISGSLHPGSPPPPYPGPFLVPRGPTVAVWAGPTGMPPVPTLWPSRVPLRCSGAWSPASTPCPSPQVARVARPHAVPLAPWAVPYQPRSRSCLLNPVLRSRLPRRLLCLHWLTAGGRTSPRRQQGDLPRGSAFHRIICSPRTTQWGPDTHHLPGPPNSKTLNPAQTQPPDSPMQCSPSAASPRAP